MDDPRMAAWAEVLVGYCVAVQPGQTVSITGGVAAEPLLRAIYRAVIDHGGHPTLIPQFLELDAYLFTHGSDAQLQYVSPLERWDSLEVDASIHVGARRNTRALGAVDPAHLALRQRARTDLMQTAMQRSATGEFKWVLTLYPTDAHAQEADMATDEFARFVFEACKLDQPDPVAAWQALRAEQQRLIDWLEDKQEVHVVGPEIDLMLSIAGRTWVNSDGKRNFPSGEIFTGPVEDSVNGTIRFSYPVVTAGREISDIRLRFVDGKVVEASAAKNEEFLIQTLDTDPGARFLGEFAFGTNFSITRFTKIILFDEKIGGNVHVAVGAGYPQTGSQNESAVHWDMICDLRQGGRVDVDGQPFLVDGRFVVEP